MKRRFRFFTNITAIFVLMLSMILPTGVFAEEAGDGNDNYSLSIMHMNDTHARADKLPKMVTAVNDFRDENPDALLLHAGDVFSGTLYFNQWLGKADLALMNHMGVDAMVFGNHEFDLGSNEGGHESLASFVADSNFPFLGTNVDFSNDPFMGDLINAEGYTENPQNGEVHNGIVKEVNGEKIGIFGLVTEDTKNIASPEQVVFEDYIEKAQEAVDALTALGVNKIIALNHLGFDVTTGSDLELAAAVDGIDVIVGGHSHTALAEPVVVEVDGSEPTVIVQAGQYADNLGTLNVEFDENGVVVEFNGELVATGDLEADAEAEVILAPFKEAVEELENTETGAVAQKELTNPRFGDGDETSVRANETELGNLITDAMLAKAKEKYPETVIAVQNGGGIRAAIDAGPITVGEVITVLPFGNDPIIAELTGAEIKEMLEQSVSNAPNENGGFLHVSGLKFTYDSEKEAFNRVGDVFVNIEGEFVAIEDGETYTVTTNGFTGKGGDGHDVFKRAFDEGRVKDIGEIDWQQLVDYMVEEQYLGGIVDPVIEGRIVDLAFADPVDPVDPEDPEEPEVPGDDEGEDGNGEGTPGEDDGAEEEGDGQRLPDTAVDMYTFMLIGGLMLIAGAGILVYRRIRLQ